MQQSPFLRTASWSVLALFCITFAISLFVPLYSDEITVKIARVRVVLDGFQLTSLFPQCGPAYSLRIPFSWFPDALIDWVIYGHVTEPVFLRVIGMSILVVWLGMVAWFVKRILKPETGLLHIAAGLASFASLGVLPFLLVLSRPEQGLLVGLTSIIMLPFIVEHYRPASHWVWVFLTMVFWLAVSYMFYSHPKAFFFLPLLIVSALHFSINSNRRWLGIALLAGLALISFDSLSFWSRRLSCPDAPFLNALLKSHNLSLGMLFTRPTEFIHAGLDNLLHSKEYIKNVLFQSHYQSNWLPPSVDQKLAWPVVLSNFVVKWTYVASFAFAILALAQRAYENLHEKKLTPSTTIPLGLSIGIFLCGLFLTGKNFYETSLILPLLLLLMVLLLPPSSKLKQNRRIQSFIFGALLIVSIVSQLNLIRTFTAYIPYPWLAGGQVVGQGLSISPFGYSQERGKVIDAAVRCGIQPGDLNSHLVIDNFTYFAFKEAYRPFHASYVASFAGQDIGDKNFFPFLRREKSAGVITACDKLSPAVRKVSREHAGYCCVAERDINTVVP